MPIHENRMDRENEIKAARQLVAMGADRVEKFSDTESTIEGATLSPCDLMAYWGDVPAMVEVRFRNEPTQRVIGWGPYVNFRSTRTVCIMPRSQGLRFCFFLQVATACSQ